MEERTVLRAIGLMSGTSLDGVDAALVETDGETLVGRGPSLSLPYDPALRRAIYRLLDDAATRHLDDPEVLDVERILTDCHVDAVRQLLALTGKVDVIGFHGQTLYHAPHLGRTWQIGDAPRLSAAVGLPVVHDFRSADVEAGGEGAPLVPWYHSACLAGQDGPIAVLNIGGVANVTFIGRDGVILAGDTGPGNALLDDWAMRHTGTPCDLDGRLALSGKADRVILDLLLSHPYFSRSLPKSLDRQAFSNILDRIGLLSPENGAATLVALTVGAVAATNLPERPRKWLISGGGRRNPALMAELLRVLSGTVLAVESFGWDGDMVEAECFGFLAVRALNGLPLSAPGITGAPHFLTGGRLSCTGQGLPLFRRPTTVS